MAYDPTDWYWQVPPDGVFWSSARFTYVLPSDTAFQDWAAAGNQVTVTDRVSLSQTMTSTVVPIYLSSGLTVDFSSDPPLSSVYALDPTTLTQVQAVAQDVASGMGFPGEVANFQYPDINGMPQTFAPSEFIALYQALRDYVYNVNTAVAALVFNVPGASLPPTTTTI